VPFLSPLAFCAGFGVQFIDQVDNIEEPSAATVSNAGPGDADSEMGFAGSGAADRTLLSLPRLSENFRLSVCAECPV